MTDNSGTKADGFNFVEIRGRALAALEGDKPEPKRKRGYYRALKRGAMWALMRKATFDMINEACKQMFSNFNEHWKENAKFFGALNTDEKTK